MSDRIIDLRSDTVTMPTPGMREAMMRAPLGDDVFGEDPTVIALEQRMAALFGHEAGLFCPSGTMTNQIALNILTSPGDEVICDEGAHVYRYEGGGLMVNSGCSVHLLKTDHGRFTAEQVEDAINEPTAQWLARSRVVSVENTCNRGGGAVWKLEEVQRIREVCTAHGLAMHLDGARIFNALAVTGEAPSTWGACFDTISICLSKGLGAPVGSVLVSSGARITEARRVRKRLGGGMRQAGILAAAGLYALDHHVERSKEDHIRAARSCEALLKCTWVKDVMPVETNIIVVKLAQGGSVKEVLERLRALNVRAIGFGPGMIRMVMHLDVDDKALEQAIFAFQKLDT